MNGRETLNREVVSMSEERNRDMRNGDMASSGDEVDEVDGKDVTPAICGNGEAGRAVYEYARLRFGMPHFRDRGTLGYDLIMDPHQWEQVREVLERMTSMRDLEAAVQTQGARDMWQLANSGVSDDCDGDYDGADGAGVRDPSLPHGWLTLLEAAYERLGDRDGLCRLYSYYIITDEITDRPTLENVICGGDGDASNDGDDGNDGADAQRRRDAHYIDALRALMPEQWPEAVARIVEIYQRCCSDPMFHSRDPMYETLLKQERLSDAAWQYCTMQSQGWRDDELIMDMFELMAQDHRDEACALLLEPLYDADSRLMSNNTAEGAGQVVALLRRCAAVMGTQRATAEAERLMGMYRSRTGLRHALEALIAGMGES
jgi:hypothetical protein